MAPDELDHKDVLFEQAFRNLKAQKALAQIGALALLLVTAHVDNGAAALPPVAAPPLVVAAQALAPQPKLLCPRQLSSLKPNGLLHQGGWGRNPLPWG